MEGTNPISYSLTSLPQMALTEYTTLHERRQSRCPKICQSLWLQYLGSYSLVSKVRSGCGWLPPEVIRIFHTPSKYLIGYLCRDHSQPSDPWPCLGSWTLRHLKVETKYFHHTSLPNPCHPAAVTPFILSYMLTKYLLPTCVQGRGFFIIQIPEPPHFWCFESSKTGVEPSVIVSSDCYNEIS